MQLKTKLFTGFLLVSIKKGFTAVTIILFGRIIEIASVPQDHLIPLSSNGLCPDSTAVTTFRTTDLEGR